MATDRYQPLTTRKYARSYHDLSDSDISLLAGILSHQPTPSVPKTSYQWKSYQSLTKLDIEKLPEHLRSHPSIWHRYINEHITDQLRAGLDEPCPMHHKLNRHLLHSMLRWVKDEISVSIPSMLFPLIQDELIRSEVREMFIQLRKVSGMWHTKGEYEKLYSQGVEAPWVEQKDRCSACILSRLGGDADALVALRAGMLARSRSVKLKDSRRMAYIETLIKKAFDEERSIKMLEDSSWIGAEVKMIWKQRRKQRKESPDYLVPSPPTPVPAVYEPFPTGPYLAIRKSEVEVSGPTVVEDATASKLDHDDRSVHSEHGEEEVGDDIYDEIEEVIKQYENMRSIVINPVSCGQRNPTFMPKPLLRRRRRANSRAISYMQDLRSNSFCSGIQSLEGDVASTTWSQFDGPRGAGGWI